MFQLCSDIGFFYKGLV